MFRMANNDNGILFYGDCIAKNKINNEIESPDNSFGSNSDPY